MTAPKKIKHAELCYYCDQPIDNLDNLAIIKVEVATKSGTRQRNRKVHIDPCLPIYKKKLVSKELKKKENNDWDDVYQYWRNNFTDLNNTQPLDTHTVKRLLGLRLGQFYPDGKNTRILPRGYGFKTILYTMMLVRPEVVDFLRRRTFADEMHKTNTIMKIIASNVNDVSQRIAAKAKNEAELERLREKNAYLFED
jgi:hypothetical protein